jgi:hypothetical protein
MSTASELAAGPMPGPVSHCPSARIAGSAAPSDGRRLGLGARPGPLPRALRRGEEVVSTGSGAACLGHPAVAAAWLAAAARSYGQPQRLRYAEPFETRSADLVVDRVYWRGPQPNWGGRGTAAVSAEAGKPCRPRHSLHTLEAAGPNGPVVL